MKSLVLTLRSLYINSLEEGCAHLPEILTSTYGMKLKLGPVIALDKKDYTWHHQFNDVFICYLQPETVLK